MPGKAVSVCTFLIICVIISYMDIQKQTIYNEAVGALFVPAIVSFFAFPEIVPISRIGGGISVSGIMLFINIIKPGAFGGGDIKMMVPIGLFLGLDKALAAGILAVFIEAAFILVGLLWRKTAWGLKRRKGVNMAERLPFGPALCVSSVIMLFFRI